MNSRKIKILIIKICFIKNDKLIIKLKLKNNLKT